MLKIAETVKFWKSFSLIWNISTSVEMAIPSGFQFTRIESSWISLLTVLSGIPSWPNEQGVGFPFCCFSSTVQNLSYRTNQVINFT